MSNGKPGWLRLVQAVDGVAAPILERVTNHDAFAIGITVADRGSRAVGRRAERLSRHILHGLNLPTATDQSRLLTQLAAVEHRVRELSKDFDDVLNTVGKESEHGFHRSNEPAQKDHA
ncbi:hypothetical protein CJ179_36335 [Rhodococcus sp. ACS1]|uniref:hypothetical protein n=1 Tax=Rhodococcus sp. ACS1 TaxID=2028570 RepID=UPI000BB11D79|nr:hypothetical protein [Rhodococcus sp. ACS1]PBC39494.1 hypothetical protein CJ179_36335 [Rhodococcus sp. ACS1]